MTDEKLHKARTISAVILLFVLGSIGVAAAASKSTASESTDRGLALFRLAGRSGRSCLSCHDALRIPRRTEQFQQHIAEQLGHLPPQDFAALNGYLTELDSNPRNSQVGQRDELVESMRSLGYLNYTRSEPVPRLVGSRIFPAFELAQGASGDVSLLKDPQSRTEQSLELRPGRITGIILPPLRLGPGKYEISASLRTPIADASPLRALVTGRDKLRRDFPLTVIGDARATASFEIDRGTPVTVSLVLGSGPVIIRELEIVKR